MTTEQERPTENGDDVARLIRLAGRRPAVPRERADRVRSATREHWQAEMRRRSRSRFRRTAVVLAAAAVIVLGILVGVMRFGPGAPDIDLASARVVRLSGSAWLRDHGSSRHRGEALLTGSAVPGGTGVETGGDGRLAMGLASGHSVRLDSGSLLTMPEPGTLVLERGAVYVDSGVEGNDSEPLIVRTVVGTVRELGTQFEVRIRGEDLRIRVREGSVVLEDDEGDHPVEAATELRRRPDGTMTVGPVEIHGPEWDWIAGVIPMIEFRGRTAAFFLDWVARERGWTISYADLEVARAAGETELSGTVEGMEIDQALAAVLPACRLTYRLERGILLIDADEIEVTEE